LNYSECQDYIDQIRDFLDPNIKIIRVDDENFTEEALQNHSQLGVFLVGD
jgi:hypothetical protein